MRFLAAIAACTIAAYGLGFYLAIPGNPEVQFWRQVVTRRTTDITDVRNHDPGRPILFFTGGSSTAFSIDPKIIEATCGMPSFNLGLPVAAGGKYLLHQALAQTRAGDLLVICLEPDLLTDTTPDGSPSKFGFAMCAAGGHPAEAAGGETYGKTPTLRDYLNLTRPGPSYLATLAAKFLTRKGYRYTPADLRYHGRIETQVHNDHMEPRGAGTATRLSPQGRELLEPVSQAAARRGVQVIYAMPWHYTAQDSVAESRAVKRQVMADIRAIMPAIDDGYAGAASDASWFSDTPQHLTAAGSSIRSKALGQALKSWLAQR